MLKKRIKRYLRDFVLGDVDIRATIRSWIISEILSSSKKMREEIREGDLTVEVMMRGEIDGARNDVRRVECKTVTLDEGDILVLPSDIADMDLQSISEMIQPGRKHIIVAADDVAIIKLT